MGTLTNTGFDYVLFDQEDNSTIIPNYQWKKEMHNLNKNEEYFIVWLDEEVDSFRKEQNLDIHWKGSRIAGSFNTTYGNWSGLIGMVKNLFYFKTPEIFI